eukprot:584502-Rhodomonas_salina.2
MAPSGSTAATAAAKRADTQAPHCAELHSARTCPPFTHTHTHTHTHTNPASPPRDQQQPAPPPLPSSPYRLHQRASRKEVSAY